MINAASRQHRRPCLCRNSCLQPRDKLTHRPRSLSWPRLLDQRHQRAANHRRVRKLTNSLHVVCIRNPESHRNRNRRKLPHPPHQLRSTPRHLLPRPPPPSSPHPLPAPPPPPPTPP